MIDQFGRWYPDFLGQQPWQDPSYVRAQPQSMNGHQPPQQPQQPAQGQALTAPIIHADIIQVDDMAAIDRHTITPGASQMFITKDEQTIVVRSMFANGQHSDDVYDKRPPAPPAPTLNPAEYVRKDELSALIEELLQSQATPRKAPTKKEEAA